MAEFLGESTGASERQGRRKPALGKRSGLSTPKLVGERTRKAPVAKREHELAGVLRDFRAGITQLGQAADRFARQPVAERITPQRLTQLRQHVPSIARILEREIQTVTKLVKAAPDIKHTSTVTRSFRERAERVIEQQLPQLFASVLRAERLVTKVEPAKVALPLKKGAPVEPAKVALPLKKGAPVEALVKAARAIRAGRLPFLPLETRKKAQTLLDRIFARPRSLEAVRAPDNEQRRLIERYSLIPLAVHHDIMREAWQRAPAGIQQATQGHSVPPTLLKPTTRQLLRTVNEIVRERTSRLEKMSTIEQQTAPVLPAVAARERPYAAQSVPSFATQGAAAGGDYMAHTGEDVHVITRNDRPLVEPHESADTGATAAAPSAPTTPGSQVQTRGSSPRGVPALAAPAARTTAPTARAPASRPEPQQAGATAGAAQAAGDGNTMKIEGTLSIPGLDNWIATIEGRTKR